MTIASTPFANENSRTSAPGTPFQGSAHTEVLVAPMELPQKSRANAPISNTSILYPPVKVMPSIEDVMDAKLEAVEARADTKIARLEGKLDLVLEAVRSSRDEARDNRRAVIANSWVIFGALVVVLGIMVTVAPAIFDLGFNWRETISREIQTQFQRAPSPTPQSVPSVAPNPPSTPK